jgi:transcriptional regulator with XRE-family HTH domain
MTAKELFAPTTHESGDMISARSELLESLRDRNYRNEFVKERVRSSIALQIQALRLQRNKMTQKELGEALGMAQAWVSKLEDPDYGKMSVATLLRLAEAFDIDLEIKFRPFSKTLDSLPGQGPDYFDVPSFDEEFSGRAKTGQPVQSRRRSS